MKSRAFAAWSILCCCIAFGLESNCGGRLADGPLGNLDDGGVFELPDGAVLFGPGSACVKFDRDASAPACAPLSSNSGQAGLAVDQNDACGTWTPTLGLAYPMYSYCGTCQETEFCAMGDAAPPGPNACLAAFDPRKDGGDALRCTLGADGDKYCSAFFQQFVRGPGEALGLCEMACLPTGNCNCEEEGDYWHSNPRCPDNAFVASCVAGSFDSCGTLGGSTHGPAIVPKLCVRRPGKSPQAESFCEDPPQ
jgi:hypothetical protein